MRRLFHTEPGVPAVCGRDARAEHGGAARAGEPGQVPAPRHQLLRLPRRRPPIIKHLAVNHSYAAFYVLVLESVLGTDLIPVHVIA